MAYSMYSIRHIRHCTPMRGSQPQNTAVKKWYIIAKREHFIFINVWPKFILCRLISDSKLNLCMGLISTTPSPLSIFFVQRALITPYMVCWYIYLRLDQWWDGQYFTCSYIYWTKQVRDHEFFGGYFLWWRLNTHSHKIIESIVIHTLRELLKETRGSVLEYFHSSF